MRYGHTHGGHVFGVGSSHPSLELTRSQHNYHSRFYPEDFSSGLPSSGRTLPTSATTSASSAGITQRFQDPRADWGLPLNAAPDLSIGAQLTGVPSMNSSSMDTHADSGTCPPPSSSEFMTNPDLSKLIANLLTPVDHYPIHTDDSEKSRAPKWPISDPAIIGDTTHLSTSVEDVHDRLHDFKL